MSLRPAPVPSVPEETARVAHAAFPHGHPHLRMRDEFPRFFEDEQFRALFAHRGRPADAPWRLALVSVLQYAEGLSDRQAADAVRRCLDWKYLLGLELTDPGFDFTLLCDFRDRLLAGSAELLLFETLLTCFRERKLLHARGPQRTDATHVLAAIRLLNRLESVGETLRHTLNILATVAPDWLRAHCRPEWVERYEQRFEEERLPESARERDALAATIGADGVALLTALYGPTGPEWLRQVPAVAVLRQVWVQQYYREETAGGCRLRWRTENELPPAPQRIISPYDPEARFGQKRRVAWGGYKVHFTETCEPDLPVLITDVQTTPPLTGDHETVPAIHAALAARDLLPAAHLVDGGYVEAGVLVSSQEDHQVDLVGPPREDTTWQAREGTGFTAREFQIRWEEQVAVCPQGEKSSAWAEKQERGKPVIQVSFALTTCRGCPSRERCTRAVNAGRKLTLHPEKEDRALQAARARRATPEFAESYKVRAGIEGTHAQGVRRCGLRRCRYVGARKVHLQHLLTAAALNFVRVAAWLMDAKRSRTRVSAFTRLMAPAAAG